MKGLKLIEQLQNIIQSQIICDTVVIDINTPCSKIYGRMLSLVIITLIICILIITYYFDFGRISNFNSAHSQSDAI